MKHYDEFKERVKASPEVAALYKAVMQSIAAKNPQPPQAKRPSWLRPACDSIPSRRHRDTDGHGEYTNAGSERLFI